MLQPWLFQVPCLEMLFGTEVLAFVAYWLCVGNGRPISTENAASCCAAIGCHAVVPAEHLCMLLN